MTGGLLRNTLGSAALFVMIDTFTGIILCTSVAPSVGEAAACREASLSRAKGYKSQTRSAHDCLYLLIKFPLLHW